MQRDFKNGWSSVNFPIDVCYDFNRKLWLDGGRPHFISWRRTESDFYSRFWILISRLITNVHESNFESQYWMILLLYGPTTRLGLNVTWQRLELKIVESLLTVVKNVRHQSIAFAIASFALAQKLLKGLILTKVLLNSVIRPSSQVADQTHTTVIRLSCNSH